MLISIILMPINHNNASFSFSGNVYYVIYLEILTCLACIYMNAQYQTVVSESMSYHHQWEFIILVNKVIISELIYKWIYVHSIIVE